MQHGFALDFGEAHLWVSLRETPCGQGLRPRHPRKSQRRIGPTALGVCYPSLRTPSKRPTAVGGQRKRIGRIAFAAGGRSLHTPFGLLPAIARQSW
jgi:hypothetical protein